MKDYKTLLVQKKNDIFEIILQRPDIHNAFDDVLISELIDVFKNAREDSSLRILTITGEGKSFCAGADINWMKRMKEYTFEENYNDSYQLSEMFHMLHTLPIPTIAKVNGAAIGGGVGLVAACDIVIASTKAFFSLSEVKIGLVPACISPYLIYRINGGSLPYYFLSGKRFNADVAKQIGLVNEVVEHEKLDETVTELVEKIISCGPNALKMAKELLDKVPGMKPEEYMKYTSKMIADLRISDEGQEGLSAFLEKRKPNWTAKG